MQHIRTTRAGATLVERSTRQLIDGERAALAALSAAGGAMRVELLHKVAPARKRDTA